MLVGRKWSNKQWHRTGFVVYIIYNVTQTCTFNEKENKTLLEKECKNMVLLFATNVSVKMSL